MTIALTFEENKIQLSKRGLKLGLSRMLAPTDLEFRRILRIHDAQVCCSVLQVCCSVLQCVAVCCSVLQCVVVCCSVLQCVAVCCSVLQLQHAATHLPLFSCRWFYFADLFIRVGCHWADILQLTATHCNTLQLEEERRATLAASSSICAYVYRLTAMHCNTLQLNATHCNALQRTATHCIALQRPASHCNALHHTAMHCNTLQHAAARGGASRHSRCCLCNLRIRL